MNAPTASNPQTIVLVHGWNHHPGIWNRLLPLLERMGMRVWKFDFSREERPSIPSVAGSFQRFMDSMRDKTGYDGRVDIVCHSLGTCAVRYYLEVMDGGSRGEPVGRLIGLGAPNTGSALADLFLDPDRGPGIRSSLEGVFVPAGWNPVDDPLVCDVRHGSRVMQRFDRAGLRNDILYRMIVTENTLEDPDFFSWFLGLTWEWDGNGGFSRTARGDGIVANRESALPGVVPDCIRSNGPPPGYPPKEYCHINMPRNPVVMDRVIRVLQDTSPHNSP